jgi:hypothetical protein
MHAEKQIAHAPQPTVRCADQEREAVPVAGHAEWPLPDARRNQTKRAIGQIWIHHTGHDETRGYGTKTREWQMDTTAICEAVKRNDTDVSFRPTFRKGRERTPDTHADFRDVNIALVDDVWTFDTAPPKKAGWTKALKLFRDCLVEALHAGRNHHPGGDGPAVKAADTEAVRAIHKKRYVSGGDPAKREDAEWIAWKRHLKDAQQAGLIIGEVINGRELIWFARAADEEGRA